MVCLDKHHAYRIKTNTRLLSTNNFAAIVVATALHRHPGDYVAACACAGKVVGSSGILQPNLLKNGPPVRCYTYLGAVP
jgi:hypothetical protein